MATVALGGPGLTCLSLHFCRCSWTMYRDGVSGEAKHDTHFHGKAYECWWAQFPSVLTTLVALQLLDTAPPGVTATSFMPRACAKPKRCVLWVHGALVSQDKPSVKKRIRYRDKVQQVQMQGTVGTSAGWCAISWLFDTFTFFCSGSFLRQGSPFPFLMPKGLCKAKELHQLQCFLHQHQRFKALRENHTVV